jgi:hypothetical protein
MGQGRLQAGRAIASSHRHAMTCALSHPDLPNNSSHPTDGVAACGSRTCAAGEAQ